MASRKERQRVLSSGLNLLPPSDKINDGDASIVDNWRVDQLGELRSRKGASEIWSSGAGTFHTLVRAGADRYAGIGTDLLYAPGSAPPTSLAPGFFDGRPLGVAFYRGAAWVMNRLRRLRINGTTVKNWGITAPHTAPTVGAVANNVISIEGWDGFVGQDPATFPGLSVGYLDDAGVFHNFPAGAASFDGTIKQEGSASLKVNATNSGLWVVTDNLFTELGNVIDTTGGIPAADSDFFTVWFYCTNPAAVSSFSVLIFSGGVGGGPAQQSASIKLDPASFNQSPNTWTQIKINRNVNADAFINQLSGLQQQIQTASAAGTDTTDLTTQLNDAQAQFANALGLPHFTEIVSGNVTETNIDMVLTDPVAQVNSTPFGTARNRGFPTTIDWTQISALQFQIELSQACVFNLDLALFTTHGILSGSGQWFVSFANSNNEDSDLSPASNILTCQTSSASLINIPVSDDPQVTQRWIWRTGFGSNQVLKVGTINDNVTTNVLDTLSVAAAQNINATAPFDRTPAPQASGAMGPYYGKIIAWSTAAHPARYFWTNSGEPWHFPGADDDAVGNWEDAGNDDDILLTVTNHNSFALIYKQRSLWLLPGDPVNVDAQQVDASIGLVGPRAVCNAGWIDYFMGPEGVYLRNSDFTRKISDAIDPIFKGDSVQLTSGEFLPPIDPVFIANSVIAIVNDRLYVSYPEQGNAFPNVTAICQLPTSQDGAYRWSRMKLNLGGSTTGFTALNYEGAGNSLMAGVSAAGTGQLWAIEQSALATDNANPIHLAWQSRFSDQGLPDNFKWYSDIEVDFQTAFNGQAPSTLSVYLVHSNGTKILLGTINSANRTTAIFPLSSNAGIEGATDEGLRAKNAAIRIEGDATSTCIIYGTYLHWYPEERQALTFDSGFTDLGEPERAKQIDYMEVYATGTGQAVQRILSSDLPGSVLAQRDTLNLNLPNGRGNVRFRLPNIVEGRNFRFVLQNAFNAPYQIHKIRFRQRVIGEYIDGTIGEFYESPEFSVAPGRVGELKDFLLDYDASAGGGSLVIYSDLPGVTGLQIRRTIALPSRASRQPFVFALEDVNDQLPYGQLFKVRVIPPNGGILRLHGRATFRARVIGVYFDGTSAPAEIWETQPVDLFGGIGIARDMAVIGQTTGPMTVDLLTELPGHDMQVVYSFPFNPAATSVNRVPIYSRLPNGTKGQLWKFRLRGASIARLFEVKLYARGVGNTETNWTWVNVPMEATPNEFAQIHMPVRETPEAFTWVDLPVDSIE